MHKIIASLLTLTLISCGEETIPKPKGQLRLEYPNPTYEKLASECNFTFDVNTNAKFSMKNESSMELEYPNMKATIYLTYKPVEKNIDTLLMDAQKLTYLRHTIKADEIIETPFINPNKKTFGMFYEVGGNAATNVQFYLTDSTKHFLTGSMYFYAKPNFDSILPAASYIKEDVRRIMESFEWK